MYNLRVFTKIRKCSQYFISRCSVKIVPFNTIINVKLHFLFYSEMYVPKSERENLGGTEFKLS